MKLSDDILMQELDDDAIILDMRSEAYYSLNETGKLILSMVIDGCSRADIVKRIVQTYDTDGETARSDFDALISDLKDKKFLI